VWLAAVTQRLTLMNHARREAPRAINRGRSAEAPQHADDLLIWSPTHPDAALERRTGVDRGRSRLRRSLAMEEAQRCLHCWVNTVFEGVPEDGSMCILCGGCVESPARTAVSRSAGSHPVRARNRAADSRQPGFVSVESTKFAADELGIVTGSAMLKYETRCIRCGLCARVVPSAPSPWVLQPVSAEPTGLISGGSHRWAAPTQSAGAVEARSKVRG